jgi:DNA-binding IscR family transcriptional regulator
MRKAGLLESKKGKGGGYFFKVDPKEIRLAQVMRLIEGTDSPAALCEPEFL